MSHSDTEEAIPLSIQTWLDRAQREHAKRQQDANCGVKTFAALSVLGLAPMPLLSIKGMARFVSLFNKDADVLFYSQYIGGGLLAVLAFIPSAWFTVYGSSLFAKNLVASERKCATFWGFAPFYITGVLVAGGTFYFATQAFNFEALPKEATYGIASVVAVFTGIPNGALLRELLTKLNSYPFLKAIRYGIQRLFCCCDTRRQKQVYRLEQALEARLILIEFGLSDHDVAQIAKNTSMTRGSAHVVAILRETSSYQFGRNGYPRYVAYCLTGTFWFAVAITGNLLYLGPGEKAEQLLINGVFDGWAGKIIVAGGNGVIAWYCVDEGMNKKLYTKGSCGSVKKYFVQGCLVATPAALFGLTLAALASNDLPFALVTGGCNFLVLLFSQAFSYIELRDSGHNSRNQQVRLIKALKLGLRHYSNQALSYIESLLQLSPPSQSRVGFLPPPSDYQPLSVEDEAPQRKYCVIC